MPIDHVILRVNDRDASVAFYTDVLGFERQPDDGPFAVLRVDDGFVLQLSAYGTQGHEHYAFALDRARFEAVLARLRTRGIAYGPSFDAVGRGGEPGAERGARGMGATVYFFDPNRHLVEIITYER